MKRSGMRDRRSPHDCIVPQNPAFRLRFMRATSRPPRNLTKTSLFLDNSKQKAFHMGESPPSIRNHFPTGIFDPRPMSFRHNVRNDVTVVVVVPYVDRLIKTISMVKFGLILSATYLLCRPRPRPTPRCRTSITALGLCKNKGQKKNAAVQFNFKPRDFFSLLCFGRLALIQRTQEGRSDVVKTGGLGWPSIL